MRTRPSSRCLFDSSWKDTNTALMKNKLRQRQEHDKRFGFGLVLAIFLKTHHASGFCPRTALQTHVLNPPIFQDSSWRRYNNVDKSDEVNTDDKKSHLKTSLTSRIHWEKVWMPFPNPSSVSVNGEEGHSSSSSLVSWEEVVLPHPEGTLAVPTHDHVTRKDVTMIVLAVALCLTSFVALVTASGPGAWRYYLAGGVCAAISHAIPVPVDVVKTRKQVDPALSDKTFVEAARSIIQQEGVTSLLAGLGPTTAGYLVEGSIKFGVYEAAKPVVKRFLNAAGLVNNHVLSLILCGAASGVAASVALLPMEALRIRLVANKDESNKNWIHAGLQMIKKEGVASFSRGMLAMLYKQVPYTIVKNVTFDLSTRAAYAWYQRHGWVISKASKVAIPAASAALASILCSISSQPGDMVLSLINAHEGEQRHTHDVVKDILRSERGVRGFFVGFKTRFLHVGIIVTLQLLLYDFIKQLCGIAATGSV